MQGNIFNGRICSWGGGGTLTFANNFQYAVDGKYTHTDSFEVQTPVAGSTYWEVRLLAPYQLAYIKIGQLHSTRWASGLTLQGATDLAGPWTAITTFTFAAAGEQFKVLARNVGTYQYYRLRADTFPGGNDGYWVLSEVEAGPRDSARAPELSFWDASVGGNEFYDLTFTTPTAALQNQDVTFYVQNDTDEIIPAGAIVLARAPFSIQSFYTESITFYQEHERDWWMRMQQWNSVRHVRFSVDAGSTYRARAMLPQLSPGSRTAVIARYTSPEWDERNDQDYGNQLYLYPAATPYDWPPRVGLEGAVGCRPYFLESFDTWRPTPFDPWDEYLSLARWDLIWAYLPTGRTMIDVTGGIGGTKAFHCTDEDDGLDSSTIYGGDWGNHQELRNIWEWDKLEGLTIGGAVRLGANGQWTDEHANIFYIETRNNFNNLGPAATFRAGANGAIVCQYWDRFIGWVIAATIPAPASTEEYVYLELSCKVRRGTSPSIIDIAWRVNYSVVAQASTGNNNVSNLFVNRLGLGPAFYQYFGGPAFVDMRFDNVYLAEPAGPVAEAFLPPFHIRYLPVVQNGYRSNFTDASVPLQASGSEYLNVDDPGWDKADSYLYGNPDYYAPWSGDYAYYGDFSVFMPQDIRALRIYAVQPFVAAAGMRPRPAYPGQMVGDGTFEYSTVMFDQRELSHRLLNPNWSATATSSTTWMWNGLCMSINLCNNHQWTALDLNAMQVGIMVTCEKGGNYGPAPHTSNRLWYTQVGVEVAVPLGPSDLPGVGHAGAIG